MSDTESPLRGKDIRKRNEKLILGLIQQNGDLSQSEAVNLTGLKPPTVLRIFTNLEKDKLIKINKKKSINTEKKGRRPVFYKINKKAAYAIGIDFCSTSASIVIVDFNRKPVYEEFVEFESIHTGETILQFLFKIIDDGLATLNINLGKILGIGIGAPGRVDVTSGTAFYFDRIQGLTDYHLKDSMEERYSLPIFVNNNCSVIAMNEYQHGIVSESRSLITLLIRSGVGGAFINEGRVFTSNNQSPMEIGHICIDPNGRECECGEKGCLESYLSEAAIIKDLQKIHPIKSFLEIDEFLLYEDKEMKSFLQEKARYFSMALKILNRSFSPDTFLIISRSALLAEKISNYCEDIMLKDSRRFNSEPVILKHTAYIPSNAGQGAADMVFSDYFNN